MCSASSAMRTCSAPRSASEKTAMLRMFISRSARTMRTAISPRLAIRTLPNMHRHCNRRAHPPHLSNGRFSGLARYSQPSRRCRVIIKERGMAVKFERVLNARRGSTALILIVAITLSSAQVARRQAPVPILEYVKQTWHTLTRTNRDLASAAVDPKSYPLPNGRWPVYVSRQSDVNEIENQLEHEMAQPDRRKIELRRLPPDPVPVRQHGLLYLPKPYVVPGGRFNEMYGWDSYFIQ